MSVNEKQLDNLAKSDSTNKCPKCGGDGMYVYMQLASEYAKERGVEDIYASRPQPYYIPVGRKCPYCNGGFIEDVKQVKKFSGIPTTFYDKRMSAFDWGIYVDDSGRTVSTANQQKGINSFIEQFEIWEEENIGLYIYSKTKGSGKTFLASCVCNELMNRRAIKTRFVSASELIDISQSGDRNANDEYKRNPLKLLHDCKFLVIDDLGQKSTGGEWLEDILFKLLDDRVSNKRMTVITSNLAIQELPFDERIIDRVNTLCMPCHLPEICVRSREINERRQALQQKLAIDRKE